MERNNPIGVFDSGLGGLTVAKELMRLLPQEDLVYYGDTARVPYGTKSKETIIRFSIENTEVLLQHQVKMVVVACNSSSSYALQNLREQFKIPIVGVILPGAKRAVETTRSGRVGVIATSATIASGEYQREIKTCDPAMTVFAEACPLFVPLAEEGWLEKKVTRDIAQEYLQPLKDAQIDTLILGCTHYPLLKDVIQDVIGSRVSLIDSAQAVAGEVKRILIEGELLRTDDPVGQHQFLTTDRPQQFERMVRNFLGRDFKEGKKQRGKEVKNEVML